jgi:hypothetical protein
MYGPFKAAIAGSTFRLNNYSLLQQLLSVNVSGYFNSAMADGSWADGPRIPRTMHPQQLPNICAVSATTSCGSSVGSSSAAALGKSEHG